MIVAFEVLSQDSVEVIAFARDTGSAEERDSQGDRTPPARNFVTGAGALSRYRTGLTSHTRLTARQAPAGVNSCWCGEVKTKAMASVGLRCGRFVAIDGRESMP